MKGKTVLNASAASALALLMIMAEPTSNGFAQEQMAAAAPAEQAPQPLSADELEVLVARIALYPDELVALISSASLYPLQIVEAERFLDDYAKDKSLKPKEAWDGSVVSLLNYPDIVKMMSGDLDWTQALADALAYQQKDVLIAIQQLRDESVAKGIIKTDDKVTVVTQNDNIVIQSASPDKVYVPRYEPEMLYVPDYAAQPISYYPDPYPNYWYPTATFFAAAVTGVAWAAALNWDDWGIWGGNWDAGDLDIDCNNCLNNINGKINFKDVDWRNIDRSKINIDRDQLAKLDRTNIKNRIEADRGNQVRDRAANIKRERASNFQGRTARAQDIRKSTLEGLQRPGGGQGIERPGGGQGIQRPGGGQGIERPGGGQGIERPGGGQGIQRPGGGQGRPNIERPAARPGQGNRDISRGDIQRPAGKPKVANRADNRPRKPSGLGNVDRGKAAKVKSHRGQKSMGGGQRGGGRAARSGGGGGRNMHRGGRRAAGRWWGRGGRGGGGRRR